MKYLKTLITVVVLSILTGCGQPTNLSGKYQSEDGTSGMEFMADNNLVIYPTRTAVKYEILKGENSQKLKVANAGQSQVFDIELKGDSLIIKQEGQNQVFHKVNEFSLKNQANQGAARAKQSEAKQYVGAMNRAQQAFYLEKSKFGTTIEEIGVVIKSETENYRYQIIPQADGKSVINTGTAKTPDLKSYAGLVSIVKDTKTADSIAVTILCEAQQPSTPPIMPTAPTDSSQTIQCPSGWSQVR